MAIDRNKTWTKEELARVNDSLEGASPLEVVKWVIDNFDLKDFKLACSFADCVLVDMLVKIEPKATIFYLDSGLLFKETHKVVERVEEKYGIKVERRSTGVSLKEMSERYGQELWKTDPDLCCEIRKVRPMKEALSGLKLWITGLRRDESPTRANAPIVGWDEKFGLIKVNPIANWNRKQVWDYIVSNQVPYNELLDKGYASIGCEPCTAPTGSGGDERSGRWAGRAKTECGLHK